MAPSFHNKEMGSHGNSDRLFSWAPKSLKMVMQPWNLKTLAPWKKSYDQPRQHITSRDITLPTKVRPFGFSNSHVWVWELDCKESWALKNWCFWTVMLEKTLESPLNNKEINQSILKKISPEYSSEGLMLKLKFQYFGHLILELTHWKRPWCWERLKAGGEGDDRGWDGWMTSLTQWIWVWAGSGRWWRMGKPRVLQSMGSQWVRHYWVTEHQQSWKCYGMFRFNCGG